MAIATLPLQECITHETELTVEYPTLSAQFGDGYEQTSDYGINNKKVIWSVTYKNLNAAQTATLTAFLDSVRGTLPFYATPRGETQQTWKLVPTSVKRTTTAVSYTDPTDIRKTITFQAKKVYL